MHFPRHGTSSCPHALRAVRHVLLVGLLSALLAACSAQAAEPVADRAPAPDPGAANRAAALARYADGDGRPAVLEVPDVVGRTAAAAEALLAEQGLELRVVAHDPASPVTTQWPPAGEPVPLDATIEGWLGLPPTEGPTASPAAAPTPAPAPTTTPAPTPTATPTEAPPAVAAAPGAARYVLPPHTDGLLRTNPRRLPALPFGTELTGMASWYGPGFQGNTTACGGRYDMNGPTLASRELRCGTVVRITGPSGRTVEATVTDWGPAEWTGRRFDLSAAVFNAIAPIGTGVIPVRVVTANVPG